MNGRCHDDAGGIQSGIPAVYDTSSEKPGYEWDKWLSLEEVIQAIDGIQ